MPLQYAARGMVSVNKKLSVRYLGLWLVFNVVCSLYPNMHEGAGVCLPSLVFGHPPPLPAAHCLRLSDVFAATPIYSKPAEPSNSSSSDDGVSAKHSTLFRHRGKKNTLKSTTVPQQEMKGFALHSLHPGKLGHVVKVQFMCRSPEMSSTWLESIRTQMQGEWRSMSEAHQHFHLQ